MKRFLAACAAMTLFASAQGAISADAAARNPATASPASSGVKTTNKARYGWSLDEARKHAHEYADKLDKITPEEWDSIQKKRAEQMKRWRAMTPEQRAAFRGQAPTSGPEHK
jgi:hypothetical protein